MAMAVTTEESAKATLCDTLISWRLTPAKVAVGLGSVRLKLSTAGLVMSVLSINSTDSSPILDSTKTSSGVGVASVMLISLSFPT